ncbi:MAG TPA: CRISPR system precrRNA processing endoribonuclease RAMP protein Cas6 [Candidatus Wallbacteria bacterium]|nr:CRISPR system precrRNA processing endoribonuclease RAMP protein Cas6 [Candidatus Wallbacteria bacterium]
MKIEYTKFLFEIEAGERIRLNPFFENTLRGMIGAQLHKLCCSNTLEKCASCPDMHGCLYSYLYNTPAKADSDYLSKYNALPHPYVFYFPRNRLIFEKGDTIIFYLTLFGRALNYLSYYVHAVSNLCKAGIGRNRAPLKLKCVEAVYSETLREKIYTVEEPFLNSFKRLTLDLESALIPVMLKTQDSETAKNKDIKLNFNTAFRIKENEKLVSEIEFSTIIKNLLRRFSNIAHFHCGQNANIDFKTIIAKAAVVAALKKDVNWIEYERFSARQNAKMKIGGIIGDITFKSAEAWKDLLKIGETIHIGKNTSFGFGNYNIEVINNVE